MTIVVREVVLDAALEGFVYGERPLNQIGAGHLIPPRSHHQWLLTLDLMESEVLHGPFDAGRRNVLFVLEFTQILTLVGGLTEVDD